jgi:SAM-dependent methyltransferase
MVAGEAKQGRPAGVREYWEQRLERDFDVSGVGYTGLGVGFNEQMYRVRRHVFRRLVAPLASPDAEVLDVASGTGFYVDRWQELGVGRITGADITEKVVSELSRRYPRHHFVRMDVGASEMPFDDASFDLVSAIDVLYHLLDEAAHARAFANLARLVRPGGHVVLSENLYREQPKSGPYQVGRSEQTILERIEAANLVVERRAPVFVLMNSPVRSGSAIRQRAWSRLAANLSRRPWLGAPVGRALYPLEVALVDRVREAPSTEYLICRRL